MPASEAKSLIHRTVFLGILLIAVLTIGVFLWSMGRAWLLASRSVNPTQVRVPPLATASSSAGRPSPDEYRRRWSERIEPRMAAADVACDRALRRNIGLVRLFLLERRAGSRAFAEDMLSIRGKWALVRTHLPNLVGGREDAELRYLADRFACHVVSDEELKAVLEIAVAAYVAQVQAIENELLVGVRADVADLPLASLPANATDEIVRAEYERLVRVIAPAVAADLGVDAARELASLVAGDVAAGIAGSVLGTVATRLGISSGILAVGAGSSWATLGLSIVAAVIADQIIDFVIDQVHDPTGKLAARVDEMLADVGRLIAEGDGERPGLRAQLTTFDKARSTIRREALRRLVLEEQTASR
ncbi:MAG: hypothetical protein KA354_03060 [Phycisphaerae bacterium]|nr:hypothetical protein [Phycisphaerae bacterium]